MVKILGGGQNIPWPTHSHFWGGHGPPGPPGSATPAAVFTVLFSVAISLTHSPTHTRTDRLSVLPLGLLCPRDNRCGCSFCLLHNIDSTCSGNRLVGNKKINNYDQWLVRSTPFTEIVYVKQSNFWLNVSLVIIFASVSFGPSLDYLDLKVLANISSLDYPQNLRNSSSYNFNCGARCV